MIKNLGPSGSTGCCNDGFFCHEGQRAIRGLAPKLQNLLEFSVDLEETGGRSAEQL